MHAFDHQSGSVLERGDAHIYFEQTGNPHGKPMALLHGGLGNLTDLNPLLPPLLESHQLVGIDFRGHGRSTLGSEALSYERHQADVEAVMDHLGIASFSILGFSDGGIVGYRLAASTPERIPMLITIGAQWQLWARDPVYRRLKEMTAAQWRDRDPESVACYEAINPAPDFGHLMKAVVKLWTDLGPSGYPGESVTRILAHTLIVRGDLDPILSLKQATELRQQIDQAQFFNLPQCSHEVHKEAPELLLPGLRRFLDNVGRTAWQ
jgi:pimeloyl-ACP methyl ester carboxylesterase